MRAHSSLRALVEQLVAWCDDANEMVDGVSRETFLQDKRAQYAASKCIEGVGECARRILQDYPSFAADHPELPLVETYRMRNRLAHGYDQVNLDIVWESARRGAPELANLLRPMLSTLPSDEP